MFTVALIILVSICAVQSDGIYGDVDAVIPAERGLIQDLIDAPKPLDESLMIQRCGQTLSVALNYLCPPHRRAPKPGWAKDVAKITGKHIAKAILNKFKGKKENSSPARQKRQLLTEECCDKACTLGTLLDYCPH